MTDALSKQINKLWHTTHIYLQPEVYKYTEKLLSKMPGDLKVKLWLKKLMLTVADPGFPRGGANLLFDHFFFQNRKKTKKY